MEVSTPFSRIACLFHHIVNIAGDKTVLKPLGVLLGFHHIMVRIYHITLQAPLLLQLLLLLLPQTLAVVAGSVGIIGSLLLVLTLGDLNSCRQFVVY